MNTAIATRYVIPLLSSQKEKVINRRDKLNKNYKSHISLSKKRKNWENAEKEEEGVRASGYANFAHNYKVVTRKLKGTRIFK